MLDSTFTVFALRTVTVAFVFFFFLKLTFPGSSKRVGKALQRRVKQRNERRRQPTTSDSVKSDAKTLTRQLKNFDHEVYPHRTLLTPMEAELLYILWDILGNRYYVSLKQNLRDVFSTLNGKSEQTLPAMTLDFVLCDPKTLAPVLVILLSNPRYDDTVSADLERAKEEFFQRVHLPVVNIPRAARYNEEVVKERIQRALRIRASLCAPTLRYA